MGGTNIYKQKCYPQEETRWLEAEWYIGSMMPMVTHLVDPVRTLS